MRKSLFWIIVAVLCFGQMHASPADSLHRGFFDFEWRDSLGKIYLHVEHLDQDFLYVNALAAGVGSNDIGLDRGQLGQTRIVKFAKHGNRILLLQPNMTYRAVSDNPKEVRAVEEAFAQSVLWAFPIVKKQGSAYVVDFTPFLLRDAHDVAGRLKSTKQGSYQLDVGRSAVWLDRTKSFPKNSEFEALLTFKGEPKGAFIRSVAADAKSISVRQHHSFIELPDDNYETRVFHPNSGYFYTHFHDYATAIHEPMTQRFIARHRLRKKDPAAAMSDPVEPIVYYIDPGCPEPIKSALIEGAQWWDQAFEAAGYRNAFFVRELPDGADPLDVRYNVIQWVHRSTRGWSYGASVIDPRTGEIIKGHVSLGSLRVRQDFMIAQGLISPYKDSNDEHGIMTEMALARLRQLSAHEVGHTLGLAHNFAASGHQRASVMDYPHPLVLLQAEGLLDFSKAYDDKIGLWDRRAILYGYQDFPVGSNEQAGLRAIIRETQAMGLSFISDSDARPVGGAHPAAHLWDNGVDAVEELERLLAVRADAIHRFGGRTIPEGTPYSQLEKVFVPLYLMHRYQIEAVGKWIGGFYYDYSVKGDGAPATMHLVATDDEARAIQALLTTLSPDQLVVPAYILKRMPPPAMGYGRDRETFQGNMNVLFDPISAGEALAAHVLHQLLHSERLNRLHHFSTQYADRQTVPDYLNTIIGAVFDMPAHSPAAETMRQTVQRALCIELMARYDDKRTLAVVQAQLLQALDAFMERPLEEEHGLSESDRNFRSYLRHTWRRWRNDDPAFSLPGLPNLPPGSPIGCGG